VLRTECSYDVARMTEESCVARSILDFDQGVYGNSISLARRDELAEPFQEHKNNNPFAGALDHCPYFRTLFDSLKAPKASFRLLRRGPHAAYSFHDDVDKGPQVIRFQIPIVTSRQAFLLLAPDDLDITDFDREHSGFAGDAEGDVWFDMQSLKDAGAGSLELFYLDPGFLYYFDTNNVHTLINAAETERITLSIDLVLNDWLKNWMKSNLTIVVPESPIEETSPGSWKWNNLRYGVIRTG